MRHPDERVDIERLMEAPSLRSIEVEHLSSITRVQDLALVSDIEEIASVGPDTLILLAEPAAMGSWMISAALRYAWERRASALIVPAGSITATEPELAKRLNVSLLTAQKDMTRLAIDIAMQIGIERSGTVARVQTLLEHLALAGSPTALLEVLSRELGGQAVRVDSFGAVTMTVADPEGETPSEESPGNVVSVPIYPGQSDGYRLTVNTRAQEAHFAEQLLRAAAPSIRALLAESRLNSIQASLPPITIAALAGSPRLGDIDEPGVDFESDLLSWPIAGSFAVASILVDDRGRLGPAVHQLWQSSFAEVPLASMADGWLAFFPVRDRGAYHRLGAAIRSCFEGVRILGLKVGISEMHSGRETVVEAVREAWLAARLAVPGPGEGDAAGPALLGFEGISSELLDRLLPESLATQLANTMLPRLLADPGAHDVVAAVVAYLSCRGSISHAARHLGVHRNTVQARIRRAEELGVPLDEPEQLLPMHLLLASVARRWARSEGADRGLD